ncbi:MAG: hypothetical protein AcusKO_30120 [Acuticoccus sp.]
MAKIKVFQGFDITDFDPEFTSTVRINDRKYVAEGHDGGDIVTIVGRGKFDASLKGPINFLDIDINGKDYVDVSRVKVSTTDTFGLPFIEQVEATLFGNDQIIGSKFKDVIQGFDGNDKIEGRNGSDTLFGGAGKDTIEGGARGDEIWGGDSRDILSGGRGADLFVLTDADSVDKIKDFSRSDTLGISREGDSDFHGARKRDIEIVEKGNGFNVYIDDDQVARVLTSKFTIDDIEFI